MFDFDKVLVGTWDIFSQPVSLFAAKRPSGIRRIGSCCGAFLSVILFLGTLSYLAVLL